MTATLLGRPLTFGDEEQIEYINAMRESKGLLEDPDFKEALQEYQDIDRKIQELDDSRGDYISEMQEIARTRGISEKNFFKIFHKII